MPMITRGLLVVEKYFSLEMLQNFTIFKLDTHL